MLTIPTLTCLNVIWQAIPNRYDFRFKTFDNGVVKGITFKDPADGLEYALITGQGYDRLRIWVQRLVLYCGLARADIVRLLDAPLRNSDMTGKMLFIFKRAVKDALTEVIDLTTDQGLCAVDCAGAIIEEYLWSVVSDRPEQFMFSFRGVFA